MAYQKTPQDQLRTAELRTEALHHSYGLLNTGLGNTLVPLARAAQYAGAVQANPATNAAGSTVWATADQRLRRATAAVVTAWPECPVGLLDLWKDSQVTLGREPNSATKQLESDEKMRCLLLHPAAVSKLAQLGFDLPTALRLANPNAPSVTVPKPDAPDQGFGRFDL